MNNSTLSQMFSLLSKLMEIHGENSFKAKSYSNIAFSIDRINEQITTLTPQAVAQIRGIGSSSASKIFEIINTGKLGALEEIVAKTPKGVLEMLKIKGLGPKRIHTIWKEMEIESLGELLYACKENRLKLYKGFGEKMQASIESAISFYLKNKGKYLYAQVCDLAKDIYQILKSEFEPAAVIIAGPLALQSEIIENLTYIISASPQVISATLIQKHGWKITDNNEGIHFDVNGTVKVIIYPCEKEDMGWFSILKSASPSFADTFKQHIVDKNQFKNLSEKEVFSSINWPYIPPFLRENPEIITKYTLKSPIIQDHQIRGIIHSHTNWSDGSNTIEEMVAGCKEMGMEYLVISDHSKSAFYANGLKEDRIKQQHLYINNLNTQLLNFTILKGIESDILNDGNLDYDDDVLSTFDIVIASIHSNLKMTEEKANARLIKAIENPYTTILGHMTGRLLLSREGYPINHKKIIDACISNDVVIELNANPHRLDIDWRQIDYVLNKGGLISINPDAHNVQGLQDIHFGVLMAQKAMVSSKQNFSSFTLDEIKLHLAKKK